MNKNAFQADESGQSIIETAFLLGVVLLVVMAFLSLGSAYYYRTNLHHMTSNIARILTLSDIQADSSQTQQSINDVLEFYETDLLFPIYTSDTNRFSISWEEETLDLVYTVYVVQAEYEGLSIPFFPPIELIVRTFSLKIETEL
ncbi:MAG: TadE/TadG family type IV pilus assembly protein [Caldisericia bacterium]|nr:TadE/TadG family type IV pilus assembly protein [Caldisericia bacterium]MDD4614367.1 TadE/TadG family type IV pilus assembly protein [Caldisericia bacterium]